MQSRQCGLCVVSLLCIGVTHLTYLNEVTMFIAGKFNSSSILGEVGVFLKSFPFSLPFVIRSVSLNWKGPLGLPLHLLKCKVEHDRLHFDNLPSLIPLVRGGGGEQVQMLRERMKMLNPHCGSSVSGVLRPRPCWPPSICEPWMLLQPVVLWGGRTSRHWYLSHTHTICPVLQGGSGSSTERFLPSSPCVARILLHFKKEWPWNCLAPSFIQPLWFEWSDRNHLNRLGYWWCGSEHIKRNNEKN